MEMLIVLSLGAFIGGLIALGSRLGTNELRGCAHTTCAEATESSQRVKLSGNARTADPLISPLRGVPCVYYAFTIHRVHERYSGTRRHRSTDIYTSSRLWANWWIEDETGVLEVEGEGAEVITQGQSERRLREDHVDRLLREYGVPEDGDYSVSEDVIPVDSEVFVCGPVKRSSLGHLVCAGKGLLVSMLSEKAMMRRDSTIFAVAATLAVACLAGALVVGVQLLGAQPDTGPAVQQQYQPADLGMQPLRPPGSRP